MESSEVNPHEDGITHVNIYSNSKCEIGKLLSNFAYSPFEHKKYGKFNSVEGLWYYIKTGCQFDELRKLHGINAKKTGKKLSENVLWHDSDNDDQFKEDIKEAIRQKLRENKHILNKLCETNKLPITHYYVWYAKKGDGYKIQDAGGEWIIEEIERIRNVSQKYLEHKTKISFSK